jgi:hypothetical protein
MATKQAIATAIKGLSANYGTAPDPALPDIWMLGLQDVDDADLLRAVGKIVATSEFFPKVATIRNLLHRNRVEKPDVDGIISRIWSFASYHPVYGTHPPSVGKVRDELGDVIADAYALVTPDRLFANSEIGRDIARREFADDLTTAAAQGHAVSLPAPTPVPALPSGPVLYDQAPERGGGFKRLKA